MSNMSAKYEEWLKDIVDYQVIEAIRPLTRGEQIHRYFLMSKVYQHFGLYFDPPYQNAVNCTKPDEQSAIDRVYARSEFWWGRDKIFEELNKELKKS